jgi:arylsulfatase A-like enzyme
MRAMWGAARLVRTLALAAVALALLLPRPPRPPRHFVLVSLDTLRADHLGAYGYDRPVSPHFDAFAARSVLFEHAVAQGPATLPSHGALMTGLYPSAYGDAPTPFPVPPGTDTLAEMLGRQGFTTWGFTDGGYLRRSFGLAQGFARYEDTKRGLERLIARIDLQLQRQRQGPGDRLFLFVHCYDVHTPYSAALTERQALALEPWKGKFTVTVAELDRIERQRPPATRDDIAPIVGLYDAGVVTTDRAFGRLLDMLERHGILQDALVVVFSDHGEEFLEHGRTQHKQLHFHPNLHVPLVVSAPGLGPRRVPGTVELIDVFPTALDVLGLPPAREAMGESLVPLMRGARPASPRAAYAEGTVWTATERTLVTDRYQLFFDTKTGTARLYDHVRDPGATHDLSEVEPALTAQLTGEVRRRAYAAAARRTHANTPQLVPAVDPDTERELRALGYIE